MASAFGGLIFEGADDLQIPAANNGAAAGNYALTLDDTNGIVAWQNAAGVATVSFFRCIDTLKRPYITLPALPGQGTVLQSNEFEEAFGTGAGGPSNPFSGIASGSTTALNIVQPSQFGTPLVPWGFSIVDVFAVYSVQTDVLTSATLSINRLRFAENVALGLDVVLAPTGIATGTTTTANTPHVQKVSLAQPLVWESADFSNLEIRFTTVTKATTAVKVFGLGYHGVWEF